jgi:precorrin-3B C17-methyltransferase
MQRNHSGHREGKLSLVGIGPGHPLDRTRRAEQAILDSDVVLGYRLYIAWAKDLLAGKTVLASGMRQEKKRCEQALDWARKGARVSLISSGDAGVYGMAGLLLSLLQKGKQRPTVEVVPGVTAANAAAARLGAPLMLDYACISLSDLLIPWQVIADRLEAVARADLVVCLYNPKSTKRVWQIEKTARILGKYRPPQTPVAVASAVGTENERLVISDMSSFLDEDIHMRSLVIVGNRSTERTGEWLVTPRGYAL